MPFVRVVIGGRGDWSCEIPACAFCRVLPPINDALILEIPKRLNVSEGQLVRTVAGEVVSMSRLLWTRD